MVVPSQIAITRYVNGDPFEDEKREDGKRVSTTNEGQNTKYDGGGGYRRSTHDM